MCNVSPLIAWDPTLWTCAVTCEMFSCWFASSTKKHMAFLQHFALICLYHETFHRDTNLKIYQEQARLTSDSYGWNPENIDAHFFVWVATKCCIGLLQLPCLYLRDTLISPCLDQLTTQFCVVLGGGLSLNTIRNAPISTRSKSNNLDWRYMLATKTITYYF